MSDERVCRRCLLRESGREDTLESIKEHIKKISPSEKTEETKYASRLDICKSCEHLLSGCCMKCGCYPEFRAAFAKQKCPVSKW